MGAGLPFEFKRPLALSSDLPEVPGSSGRNVTKSAVALQERTRNGLEVMQEKPCRGFETPQERAKEQAPQSRADKPHPETIQSKRLPATESMARADKGRTNPVECEIGTSLNSSNRLETG